MGPGRISAPPSMQVWPGVHPALPRLPPPSRGPSRSALVPFPVPSLPSAQRSLVLIKAFRSPLGAQPRGELVWGLPGRGGGLPQHRALVFWPFQTRHFVCACGAWCRRHPTLQPAASLTFPLGEGPLAWRLQAVLPALAARLGPFHPTQAAPLGLLSTEAFPGQGRAVRSQGRQRL